jgi:hypothetical protein
VSAVAPELCTRRRGRYGAAPSDLAAGELQRSADRVRIERLGAQALRRCELTRTTMTTVPLSHPPQVIAAIARIYCNALRLRLRGAPVFPGLRANTRKGLVPRLVHKSEVSFDATLAKLQRAQDVSDGAKTHSPNTLISLVLSTQLEVSGELIV